MQPPSVLPNPPVVPVSAARVPKVKLPKVILKRFDGSLIQWATFWDMFESSIHTNLELSDIDKFNYLHSLLEGSAADSISGLSLTASNYSEAIAILKRRFGNKQQVVNRHMDLLLELEPVFSMRVLKKLRHLYDQVEGHVRNLRSLGVSSESYGSLLSPIVMKRLPQELCIIVSKQVGSDSWNLDQMMEIIEKELEARERASMNSIGHNTQIQTRKSHDHPTAAVLVATNASFSCYYCGEQHVSTSCKTVTNPDARRQILLKTGRCFICLRKGHMGKDCRSSTRCASCRGRHHTSICGSTRNPQGSTSPVPSSSSSQLQQGTPLTAKTGTSSVSLYVDMRTPVLLQTATTMAYSRERLTRPQKVRLILDSGSQKSYVSAKLRDILKLSAEQSIAVAIKTFGAETEKVQNCDIVKLLLKTKSGTDLELSLHTVPFICEPLSGQPMEVAVERFSYLHGLDLADADPSERSEIDVLIGADYYRKVATGRIKHGRVGPTAVETRFGWVLSGPVPGFSQTTISNFVSSHVLKVGCTDQLDLASLDKKLQVFWDLNTMGIREGEDCIYSRFTKNISLQDGRYCVHLPWKEPHPLLPDNYELSKGRLFNLLRRLRQSPDILNQYDAVIQDQIKCGIVEVVEAQDSGIVGRTHYIPHHAVIREDKQTTKLRIVYDASARSGGPSLNDCLFAGPTFGQNILDIILRFRLYRVALSGDIEKAFLMISVSEEDRDVLRFLWVEDLSSHLPRLVTLRFARVVFGVSSSRFLLNATLRYHMERYRTSDPSFVDQFVRSVYVDGHNIRSRHRRSPRVGNEVTATVGRGRF